MSTRRQFLKGVLALSALPLLAGTDRDDTVLRFLHVTDSHMDLHHPKTVEAMRKLVERVNSDYRDIDFVLFGGDNFNNNAPGTDDAKRFKEIIEAMHCPGYLVRGNKESSPKGDAQVDLDGFKRLFFTPQMHIHGKDWMIERKGVVILGLDSCVEGGNNGRFTPETLAFAEEALKTGRPTVILDHHSYVNYWGGTDPKDIHKYVLNNAEETIGRLFGYENLVLALSGHRHIDNVTMIGHVPAVTTRAFISAFGEGKYPMRYVEISRTGSVSQKLVST
ncbi:metallophosphoesterase family protein [Hydrogenimonas sp.]